MPPPAVLTDDGGMAHPGITRTEQLAALGHAVITTDVEGTVVDWNPAAEELYGWTAEEAIGQPITKLSVPDLARDVAEEIMDALRAGESWSGSFPVRDRDGRVFPALVTDTGVFRGGELVGIVGVSTHLGTAIRPLLERSADAALLLRPDAVIMFASPAVRRLFHWDEDELVGTSFLDLLHPDYRPRLSAFMEGLPGADRPRPVQEVRVRRGDGWSWAEAAFTSFLDDPLVRGIVCNLRRSLAHWDPEEPETPDGP